MIVFDAKMTVVSKQDKKIPRRDGKGDFEFTEYLLRGKDRQKTAIQARIIDGLEIEEGVVYNFRIGIGANVMGNGRIFNNFVILDAEEDAGKKQAKEEPVEEEIPIGDDIPF